jgi:hypothetical protein
VLWWAVPMIAIVLLAACALWLRRRTA